MDKHVDITEIIVRDEDGEIDMTETLSAFEDIVLAWEEEGQADNTAILQALNKAFDKHHGKALSVQALTFEVMNVLGLSVDSLGSVQNNVSSVVKANPALFEQTRGPNGGTRRIADKPRATTSA